MVYTIPGTKLKVSSSSGIIMNRLLFVFPSPSIPVPNSSNGMSLEEKISRSSSLSKGCILAFTVIMTERIVSSGPPRYLWYAFTAGWSGFFLASSFIRSSSLGGVSLSKNCASSNKKRMDFQFCCNNSTFPFSVLK